MELDQLLQDQLEQAGYGVQLGARQKSLQATLTIKAIESCMSQLYMARQAILAMCDPHVRSDADVLVVSYQSSLPLHSKWTSATQA
jgi:hypothetical protein